MKKLLNILPNYFIIPLFLVGGIIVGIVGYLIYVSSVYSYMSDEPTACVNCHIMSPYYQSWQHSSHGVWTNCNDCHVPNDNMANKYIFKAIDGVYHAAVFTMCAEPQVIRPREASSNVIMANCIRCHTQLNTEFVNTGMIDYTASTMGEGKACWDCHRDIPHTTVSNTASAPNVIAPMPESPVPSWLKNQMKNNKTE